MELRYKTTSEEYIRFVRRYRVKRILKVSAAAAAIFLAVMFFLATYYHYPFKGYAIIFGIDVAYFGVLVLLLRSKDSYLVKRQIKKIGCAAFDSPKTLILGEEELELKSSVRELKVPYSGIQLPEEGKDYITIKFKAGDMIYIPVNCIQNPENSDAFFTELKQKISQRL